jgi:hypothetical protein
MRQITVFSYNATLVNHNAPKVAYIKAATDLGLRWDGNAQLVPQPPKIELRERIDDISENSVAFCVGTRAHPEYVLVGFTK